jgi:enoyl-CoA hydratase/carnithine racemase
VNKVLKVEDRGATRRLVLNRPHRRNALDPALVGALRKAFEEALVDPSVDVIVIAGEGRSFCAGADLTHLHDTRDTGGPIAFLSEVSDCFTAIAEASKPVVGALHGHVVAGGLELALACDVLVAEEDTQIGDGHVAMGLLPGAGSSVRLPRRLPEPLARWLLLTGELLPVTSLHDAGLVHRVAAAGTLDAAVEEVCRKLAEPNRHAQRAMKALLREQAGMSTEDALATELGAFHRHWTTAELPELAAFVDRTEPAPVTEIAAGA